MQLSIIGLTRISRNVNLRVMEIQKQVIYLDNNATTQIDKRVLDAMMPFLTHEFANANSTHQFGVHAYEAVKSARVQVSDLIGAEPHEIVFTSGATEAINLAIKGVAEKYQSKGKHIVTVATEHSAVLDTCQYLETKGFEVTYLSVKPDGLIDLEELKTVLRDDTILVSVMLANNETGVIQAWSRTLPSSEGFASLHSLAVIPNKATLSKSASEA